MTAKQFNRLTPARRRMAIAADVIATLAKKDRHYSLVHNAYCRVHAKEPIFRNLHQQMQELLPEIEGTCNVCGIGAMFISHVRLANAITVGEANSQNSFFLLDVAGEQMISLMDYFPDGELRMIETAYEGVAKVTYAMEVAACRKWTTRYPDDEDRLRAICRNIIRNEGNFIPTNLPRQRKKAA